MSTKTNEALAEFKRLFPKSMLVPGWLSTGGGLTSLEMWVKRGKLYSRMSLHHGKQLLSTFGGFNDRTVDDLYKAWLRDPDTRHINSFVMDPKLDEFPDEHTFNLWAPDLIPSTLLGDALPGTDPDYDRAFAKQQGLRDRIREDLYSEGPVGSREYRLAAVRYKQNRELAAKNFGEVFLRGAQPTNHGTCSQCDLVEVLGLGAKHINDALRTFRIPYHWVDHTTVYRIGGRVVAIVSEPYDPMKGFPEVGATHGAQWRFLDDWGWWAPDGTRLLVVTLPGILWGME